MTTTNDQHEHTDDALNATETDEQTNPATDTPDSETDAPEGNGKNDREASKLRKRAQAAESERDTLVEQVTALQGRELEAICDRNGIKSQAVLTVAPLADLVADDGTIDGDKVAEAIETARDQLGISPVTKGAYVPSVGHSPAGKPKSESFADAFKPKRES